MFDIENSAAPMMPKRQARVKARSKLPPGCGRCNGRPWVIVAYTRLALDDRDSGEPVGRAFDRCTCERGRALAAKDREREAVAR